MVAGGPGRWVGWAGPGATVRGWVDPRKLKFGIGSVAVPIGGIFHKFTVYLCCTYVGLHLTFGAPTDTDQGRIQLSLLGGGPIRLGKNLTDCLKDILLASQDWVKDGKRFRLGSLNPLLFLFIFIYLFIYFFLFFFFLHMTHTRYILRCIFSRIYQFFHLL